MLSTFMRRRYAERIAWRFLGKPYYWGGDDPLQGFDCSGFMIEILKGVNLLPRPGDWNADTLAGMFPEVLSPSRGCLLFWMNREKTKYIHVEMALNNELQIGASGGGMGTKVYEDAVRMNAYIKVRPIPKTVAKIVDPFKLKPGWWNA